ncbi:hypothetical protein BC832DRAFT_562439 [Gaertneriomyces semiglobifer]|nr:hypothetical protein BC832DRAFT_562439 [Gaertneriomyces semiglobifer]
MTAVTEYLQQVAAAIAREDGEALAEFTDLLMTEEWVGMLLPDLQRMKQDQLDNLVEQAILSPYDLYVKSFLNYLNTPDERDYYDVAASVFAQFCQPVFAKAWHVPVVKRLCEGLMQLAVQRDAYLKKLGKKGTTYTNLQNRFSWLMSLILVDRPGFEGTKAAALVIANIALRFYANIDEWHLCTKLIRQIDQRRLDLGSYPMSQRVTFHFLVGRLKLQYQKYRGAEKHLAFALEHCHAAALQNRRTIFVLLLVARMVRGVLPHQRLLEQFELHHIFGPLIGAYKQGNFRVYDQVLEQHRAYFSALGTYFDLQMRTRMIMYRNLFRRVWVVLNQQQPTTQLDYNSLSRACRFGGVENMSIIGVESIVVSMISQGYMKGYTLPGRGVVVVSKNHPFPNPYQLAQTKKRGAKKRLSHAVLRRLPGQLRRTSANSGA